MGDGSRSRRGRPIRLSSRGCGEPKKCSLRTTISSDHLLGVVGRDRRATQACRGRRRRSEVAISDDMHTEYANILHKTPSMTITL